MAAYFSAGVRAVLHTFKDVVEALLDPSRHAHLNSLTGMVSTCFVRAVTFTICGKRTAATKYEHDMILSCGSFV